MNRRGVPEAVAHVKYIKDTPVVALFRTSAITALLVLSSKGGRTRGARETVAPPISK